MSNYKVGDLLNKITIPKDLRDKISEDELPQLCEELRDFIVDVFRGSHHIFQHKYEAKDLIDKNIDRVLMSNGILWSDFKKMMR